MPWNRPLVNTGQRIGNWASFSFEADLFGFRFFGTEPSGHRLLTIYQFT
jgi:hypothetical protein